MSELIILAVLWFAFSKIMAAFKKKRLEEQDEAQGTAQPQRAPVAPIQARQTSVWDQIQEMYEEGGSTYSRDTNVSNEGDSAYEPRAYTDAQGCIGGSIEHVQHEGDYTTGSLHYVPTTEYNPVDFGETEQKPRAAHVRLTGKDMRRAVIMAEVLGKPVTLRGE